MQYAAILINALHVYAQHLLQDIDFIVQGESAVASVGNLPEYPRSSECRAPNHYSVDTILIELLPCRLIVDDITVSYYRDMYFRVVPDLAYERPVGIAGIHLAPRASMDGQSLYAAVLKLAG